ncbi:LOW QUALITY PROTEIN: hypothetical protein HID58_074491 [Brassica napus]|uniref:Myb/SANT-like domain-containing protein n=1 Tax=Brassica napus TaxID=3708 RepID=A0ABQ7YGX4_BRANA|nr:LOW QUALITY PROTEIN: hypothetical protein HID58_074491 [Brassica napus]
MHGGGTTQRKKQKQIIWEDEHIGIYLELLDIELAKIRYRQKLPKKLGRERICKDFLEKTGISLPWDSFKSKYDTLRNMYGSYKRLKNFTGVSADDNTGLIEMDSEWWPNGGTTAKNKPEAMYSTHFQDAKYAEQNENEQLDKSVPETQDNDGDDSNIIHTTDVHHHSQTISLDSPPRSPIGPSKRKQTRVAPYESSRGKDVCLSREKNIPRRRKS